MKTLIWIGEGVIGTAAIFLAIVATHYLYRLRTGWLSNRYDRRRP